MVLRPCEDDYGGGGDDGGYVDCGYPRNGDGGGHHFYESIENGLESFRLKDGDATAAAADPLNDDSSSIASKKRIDSMFKATVTAAASAAGGDVKNSYGSDAAGRRTGSLADRDHGAAAAGDRGDCFDYGPESNNNKNTVQEKIEKMFAEIGSSEPDTDASAESAVASNKYHVQYIGCAGLSGKISSLEGLQKPVRDMYFGYREGQERRRGNACRRDFSGLLEISAAGLTIRYRDEERGESVRQTNPFPSIAVWAALKYVCRRRSPAATAGAPDYEYAFLPLIADPDGTDKAPLFREVDAGDRARLDAAGDHAPVFAVVTRTAGKRLECHGFTCETENDALLMAANLYGALVAAMSTLAAAAAAEEDAGDAETAAAGGRPQVTAPAVRRVIRQRNGFTSMSSTAGSSVQGDADVAPPALPPPRPPRRDKKTAKSSATLPSARGDETDDVCGDAKTFSMTVRQPPSLRRGVCNSSGGGGDCSAAGDILTKVAIPRSRSFLGLASSKYPRRTADCGGIDAAADGCGRRSNGGGGGGGGVMQGLSDMFNELRLQEGLSSVDDILNAIINVEGMSYNDLKPLYREFLMKLSMTLTKDELYLRTKAIMAEQKRRRGEKRRPTLATGGRRVNKKLRGALDLRAAKSRIRAALLPDVCCKRKPSPCGSGTANGSPARFRPGSRKPTTKNPLRQRRAPSSPVCWSASDDSDLFLIAALRQRQRKLQQQQLSRRPTGGGGGVRTTASADRLQRTSSGYVSCSECSAADDRCCSSCGPASLVSCSCDSDSCADSDKCYCGRPRRPRNTLDELKSRGFAASESSVSRADSPGTAWKKNESLVRRRGDGDPSGPSSAACVGGIESSKSLEYLQMTRRPVDRVPRYSNVAKPAADRTQRTVYGGRSPSSSSTSSTSSTSWSPSVATTTVCSSSSVARRQRRSGSTSGSDNFRAIDYALFANSGGGGGGGGRKPRGGGGGLQQNNRGRGPAAASEHAACRRSYSSEAVARLADG